MRQPLPAAQRRAVGAAATLRRVFIRQRKLAARQVLHSLLLKTQQRLFVSGQAVVVLCGKQRGQGGRGGPATMHQVTGGKAR